VSDSYHDFFLGDSDEALESESTVPVPRDESDDKQRSDCPLHLQMGGVRVKDPKLKNRGTSTSLMNDGEVCCR
jgi:hypothetical protein